VAERGHLAEQLRQHGLACDQELDRLDPLPARGLDQVLPLDREEAGLLTLLPPGQQLPDQPEPLVLP
jgi:hypothetical protein